MEILFRGRDMKTGEWLYGNLITDDANINDSQCFIRQIAPFDTLIEYRRVVPETVGQFSGLKDCNGNRIYEGDILQDPNDATLLKVEWNEDKAGFYAYEIDGCWCYGANEMVCFNVVGNKWDDPELLREMDKGE